MRKVKRAALGNAFIWAAAITTAAAITRGSQDTGILVTILGGAAGASIITVGNKLRARP